MTTATFVPAVSKIEYSVNGITTSDTIVLDSEPKNIKINFTFAGLRYLTEEGLPTLPNAIYPEIFLYFSHYTRRGIKDIAIHSIQEKVIESEIFPQDGCVVEFDLGSFSNEFKFEDQESYFKYDISNNALFVKLNYAIPTDAAGIKTYDEKYNYLFESGNEIVTIKVPMVTLND